MSRSRGEASVERSGNLLGSRSRSQFGAEASELLAAAGAVWLPVAPWGGES